LARKAFHLDRPCFRFGAVARPRRESRAPDPGAKYYLARFGAHDIVRAFSRRLRACAIFFRVFGFAAVHEASKFIRVECGAVIGRLWRLLPSQGLGPSKPSYEAAQVHGALQRPLRSRATPLELEGRNDLAPPTGSVKCATSIHYHEPGCHHRAVSRGQPVCRQPRSDAGRVSGLPKAPIVRSGAEGRELATARWGRMTCIIRTIELFSCPKCDAEAVQR
jgi:hypothetical protein